MLSYVIDMKISMKILHSKSLSTQMGTINKINLGYRLPNSDRSSG
jgi:hypothetical protein